MRANMRNLLILPALVLAAVASWYWNRPRAVPAPPPRQSAVPRSYYLKDAVLFGTDDTGRVIYEVRARRAEEAPESNELALDAVEVEYRPATEVHWRLRADAGEAPLDGSQLVLEGNVELESRSAGESTTVRTERVELDPQEYVASSSEPTSVSIGKESLTAVGMKAYLKDDRLELESRIHGNFLP